MPPSLQDVYLPEMERGCDNVKRFGSVQNCSTLGRAEQTIVSDLDGTLLRSKSSFPYYMLLALEAGSPLRAFLLLLLCPIVWFIQYFCVAESLALQILIFVSMAGLKASDVAGVSKAVLPKFFLEDMHIHSYRVFISCGKRYVVTSNPSIMVEHFLKTHMGVNQVFGTEVQVTRGGYCTGLVAGPGVLMDCGKAEMVKKVFGDRLPDVGLGNVHKDYRFLSLCKEAFFVPDGEVDPVPRDQYLSPLVFHDGRLVMRPTPIASLAIFLWMPIGLLLSLLRISIALCLPMEAAFLLAALLGMCVRVKGAPPLPVEGDEKEGILFACSHRSLMDPTFLSMALRRKVRALTYSVSRISEIIAPIRTAHLTRDRAQDAVIIGKLLEKEDVFVCPEGTTCREPFLLRFSSLFAELTDRIVPVAMNVRTSMFHGTTARGYKSLDAFFFLMNPRPEYEIIFLERLPREQTVSGGKSSIDVAKYVQQQLAEALGYHSTGFTRKDKYTILAGHDGTVKDKRFNPRATRGGTEDDKAAAPARGG